MQADALIGWIQASLLLSLRIAPVFAMAPPFTLVRLPALFRLLLALGLAASIASYNPAAALKPALDLSGLVFASAQELFLGMIFVLAFQLTFGAIYTAGRTIDIQAGFGLAALIDPTTRAQTPLVGTIYAYLAGAIFFAMNGHHDLLRIIAASLETVPLGAPYLPASPARVGAFMSVVFLAAIGVAGGVILCLFLADLAIALLARTAPQMNALVLGFQVKTVLLLIALPMTLGLSAVLLSRMLATALQAVPRLLHG